MGGDAAELNVGPLQTVPGKRQKRSEFARKPREEVGPADVREKADPRFWHREDGLFGGDSVLAVNRETDAAAHRDPVDQGDVRNPESSNLPKNVKNEVIIFLGRGGVAQVEEEHHAFKVGWVQILRQTSNYFSSELLAINSC